MAFNESSITRYPGGLAQFVFMGVGAVAGNVTVAGVAATDRLIGVEAITFDTSGYCTAVADLTSEFTVTGANTINNTAGTSTANKLVVCTVARTKA